jgi:tRNA G18 (ribose-2'-O)-methylase SpoU
MDDSKQNRLELMQEIHKHPESVRRIQRVQNNQLAEYLTAKEWKDQCLAMVDEIFDKHEQGLL